MQIDFHDQTNNITIDQIDLLRRLIDFTAKKEGVANGAEVSINVVDNKEIQELNRTYRQQDMPTDVISFALQDPVAGVVEIIGDDLPIALGDIVISIDKAREQAVEYNHSLERELGFLTVHGFLHLLGYNHLEKADEEIMFQKQVDILDAFGLER